ncbi:unnamed protein product [Clonostachys rosea]|uniref:Rrn9 domain-containing protein n=1 Tax=Bionectria ochroleuca TaxID=29856 RepID=A0ABY6UJG5_BIOOC|nr:unnamed protein product [Clonostachys rosea]
MDRQHFNKEHINGGSGDSDDHDNKNTHPVDNRGTEPLDNDGIGSRQVSNNNTSTEPLDNEQDVRSDGEGSRMWTPEPRPLDFESSTEWGRKHFGEDWYQKRKLMIDEVHTTGNASTPSSDPTYKKQQEELRQFEMQRQEGKLPRHGRTWGEVHRWARAHYGQEWYMHQMRSERDLLLSRVVTEGSEEEERYAVRSTMRANLAIQIRTATDRQILSQGYTWNHIMEHGEEYDSQDDDEVPTPAMNEPPEYVLGSRSPLTLQAERGPRDAYHNFEWDTIRYRNWRTQKDYEERREAMTVNLRSGIEDRKCSDRWQGEVEAIHEAMWTGDLEGERAARKVRRVTFELIKIRQDHGLTDAEAREYMARHVAQAASLPENEGSSHTPPVPVKIEQHSAVEAMAEVTAEASTPLPGSTQGGATRRRTKGQASRAREGTRRSQRKRELDPEFRGLQDPEEPLRAAQALRRALKAKARKM